MKKLALSLLALVILAGCSSTDNNEDPNRNDAVVPTVVRVTDRPSPTEEVVIIGLPANSTPVPTAAPVVGGRPTNLPVLFEYLAFKFDMEFFYDNTQYFYYGLVQTSTPCHEVDKIISVSETLPELVIIDIRTINTNNDCEEKLTTLQFDGTINVRRTATFKIIIDGEEAQRYFPTPTPTPRR